MSRQLTTVDARIKSSLKETQNNLLEVLKEQAEQTLLFEDFKVKMDDWDVKINNEMETILGCDVKVGNLKVNLEKAIQKCEEDTKKFATRRVDKLIKSHLNVPGMIGETGEKYKDLPTYIAKTAEALADMDATN